MPAVSRRAAIKAATRRVADAVPAYQLSLRPVRGRCRKRRCTSRWAVPRSTIDTRDPRAIERVTVLECAGCGRAWRRVRDVPVQRRGMQSALVTLILPPAVKARRYTTHGSTKVVGDDARVIRNAGIGDTDDAAHEWRRRSGLVIDRKARVKARKAESDAVACAAGRAVIAAIDARRAAEAAEESAAAAREAAY